MVSTVHESINGGPNCKTNQKARCRDDAACIAREGEVLTAEPNLCVLCVERVNIYIYMASGSHKTWTDKKRTNTCQQKGE